ncbi:response regulator transcription factor [Dehalococcoides mccartyi]|uniref:response regulator n=1 Tax=Dehalococcoides mccartyi TaxID=61435 RepID=UPI000AB8BD09|nr:response regulator transcription factor [Dehalococcoides mccartyi]
MYNILIVDDHPIVRAGMKSILNAEKGMFTLDEAQNARETMLKVSSNNYDLILLDLTLPDNQGLNLLKDIKTIKKQTPILILSVHPEEQYGIRCLKAGASGFISKESAPFELIKAIRKIQAGGRYISPTLAEIMATQIFDKDGPRHLRLSDREFDIFIGIAQGLKVTELAEKFKLSPKTIYTYREHVFTKMGFNSNVELARYANSNDLIV